MLGITLVWYIKCTSGYIYNVQTYRRACIVGKFYCAIHIIRNWSYRAVLSLCVVIIEKQELLNHLKIQIYFFHKHTRKLFFYVLKIHLPSCYLQSVQCTMEINANDILNLILFSLSLLEKREIHKTSEKKNKSAFIENCVLYICIL